MSQEKPQTANPIKREDLNLSYRMDEAQALETLIAYAQTTKERKENIEHIAGKLVTLIRKERLNKSGLDSFLSQYDLGTQEGIALMCIAEALLRIPDTITIDKLIRDKLTGADWQAHAGQSPSLFVNAATWGLMLTGKILSTEEVTSTRLKTVLKNFLKKSGEPVIRQAVKQAMKILGKQFVMGRTIEQAVRRAQDYEKKGYTYSYDMLGEAARTLKDAENYFAAYIKAIEVVGAESKKTELMHRAGISVKLSALHPRYEYSQRKRVVQEMVPLLTHLALEAKKQNIALTVDAEEADRLDLSLEIIEQTFLNKNLEGWEGFGLAVQAYQKRAFYLIDWLVQLARKGQRRIMIRLVKGAYWDSEIKWAQELGLKNYPVFTRKVNTDVSYLACAKKMIQNIDYIYPAFATHNAHTVASIIDANLAHDQFEFQCLHGMGEALYDSLAGQGKDKYRVRIYAPVGQHEDLLPYLVRRLLENGANTSFVNRITDETLPVSSLVQDPIAIAAGNSQKSHPKIPVPKEMLPGRKNSSGIDLSDSGVFNEFKHKINEAQQKKWQAGSAGKNDKHESGTHRYNPANNSELIGNVMNSSEQSLHEALDRAHKFADTWEKIDVTTRAGYLQKTADLFETHFAELMALAIKEGGKTWSDAVAEVREAIDFCRYYAKLAMDQCSVAEQMPGPTGEMNLLSYHGRGPVLCISPWNFPLAIFTGQVVAALVAGNPVLAKPAEQTPLIADYAVKLMHQAGIPEPALQLLICRGSVAGKILVADSRVKGIVFTGSTETAQHIQRTLANRSSSDIVPLIAETGGQNTMIVDSSALLEQVVADVINSAFRSAGQRCSALRVLYVQNEIAERFIELLQGAMAELVIGDPIALETDIGPVINADAQKNLMQHVEKILPQTKLIFQCNLTGEAALGSFMPPTAIEIKHISELKQEVFGPILHIIRFHAKNLDQVVKDINQTGYGLTLGIQSRINETVEFIRTNAKVGNCYVNRNIIGAVVGVQPFGGEGLSGTGPKAGGPNYVKRLMVERTLTINTTAAGGNASLLTLEDE